MERKYRSLSLLEGQWARSASNSFDNTAGIASSASSAPSMTWLRNGLLVFDSLEPGSCPEPTCSCPGEKRKSTWWSWTSKAFENLRSVANCQSYCSLFLWSGCNGATCTSVGWWFKNRSAHLSSLQEPSNLDFCWSGKNLLKGSCHRFFYLFREPLLERTSSRGQSCVSRWGWSVCKFIVRFKWNWNCKNIKQYYLSKQFAFYCF